MLKRLALLVVSLVILLGMGLAARAALTSGAGGHPATDAPSSSHRQETVG